MMQSPCRLLSPLASSIGQGLASLLAVLLLCGLSVVEAPAAQAIVAGPPPAQSFTTDVFSFSPPMGWKQVSQAAIDAYELNAGERYVLSRTQVGVAPGATDFKLDYAFAPAGAEDPFDSPYIALDVSPKIMANKVEPTVLAAMYKAELVQAIGQINGKPPVVLYEQSSPSADGYMLELKVLGNGPIRPGVHGAALRFDKEGFVQALWYTSLSDYGYWVDTLRNSMMTLTINPALRR